MNIIMSYKMIMFTNLVFLTHVTYSRFILLATSVKWIENENLIIQLFI